MKPIFRTEPHGSDRPEKPHRAGLPLLLALTAALFIIMLILCGMYLDLRVNGLNFALPRIPENDKWILSGSGYNAYTGAGTLLSPTFIGFKTANGEMTAAAFDKTAADTLTAYLHARYDALFCGHAERISFADESEKEAYLTSLCRADSFVYASYYDELPAAAILPSVLNGGISGSPETDFFVKYLFLLPDEGGNLYAVCLDAELEATVLTPSTSVAYNTDELAAYNGVRGYAPFAFVAENCPIPVFTRSFDVDSVTVVPSSSYYSFTPEDERTKALLKTLDFNTNMVKSFRSGDNGTISFVEDGKELYVSVKEGWIRYTGYETGIHMSHLLRYYPADGKMYSFADEVLCVKYLISSLDRMLIGGDAAPSLVRIARNDEDSTVFSLKYFYNGVMLTENDADITVEIRANAIRRIDIRMLYCNAGTLQRPVIPQSLALGIVENGSLSADGLSDYGALFVSEPDTNRIDLVWVERKRGQDDVS